MSHIVKNGKPVGIGRNVKFTGVPDDLKYKRRALFEGDYLGMPLESLSSREFYLKARRDPVTFTYTLWRIFKDDASYATEALSNMAIKHDAGYVIRALEIMLFEASTKINALCLSFIISRLDEYIKESPKSVKKALKRMLFSDFSTTVRVMKGMYESSPRVTKSIAKSLINETRYRLIKTFIKPMLRIRG